MFWRSTSPLARIAWGIVLAFVLLPAIESRATEFSGMAGAWTGTGTIAVNNNREKLRCRANYNVSNGGATVDLQIRCASDSYKFDLSGGVNAVNGNVSGTWSEFGARRGRRDRRHREGRRDLRESHRPLFLRASVAADDRQHAGGLAELTGQPDLLGDDAAQQGWRQRCGALSAIRKIEPPQHRCGCLHLRCCAAAVPRITRRTSAYNARATTHHSRLPSAERTTVITSTRRSPASRFG